MAFRDLLFPFSTSLAITTALPALLLTATVPAAAQEHATHPAPAAEEHGATPSSHEADGAAHHDAATPHATNQHGATPEEHAHDHPADHHGDPKD